MYSMTCGMCHVWCMGRVWGMLCGVWYVCGIEYVCGMFGVRVYVWYQGAVWGCVYEITFTLIRVVSPGKVIFYFLTDTSPMGSKERESQVNEQQG